jgi:hypothetical protein
MYTLLMLLMLATKVGGGSCLLAKQPPDALQHTVLLGVVGVVLGGDLEQRGESGRVCLDAVSYALGDLGHVRLPVGA